MSDLIQDVRDYFSDRFSSPLWLSIIVSWLLINWQLPITAIFETSRFNVAYIRFYMDSTDHWCLVTIPVLLGLTYSILSSSIKETLELSSRVIRNIISQIGKGTLYSSISISDHEKQISRFKRQIEKIEAEKEKLNEIELENSNLIKERNELKGNLIGSNTNLAKRETELEDIKNQNQFLNNEIIKQHETIKTLQNSNIELISETTNLNKILNEEKATKDSLLNKKSDAETKIKTLTDKCRNIEAMTTIIKNHISIVTDEIPIATKKLINDLETAGIVLNDKKEFSIVLKNTYYDTIKENGDSKLNEELTNPHSSASIFLLLEAISNLSKCNQKEIQHLTGVPEYIFDKTLKTTLDAHWVTEDYYKFCILSEIGKEKLAQLFHSNSLLELRLIIEAVNKKTEEYIGLILLENHLSMPTLKQKVGFNYSIGSALKNLLNDQKITKSGNVFSVKDKSRP